MLQATGAAGALGFAGCLSNVTDGGDGGSNTMELLHGWTGGDGKAAINALTDGFDEAYPDVETDYKPIGGGGNTNLNTVVANRLSQNNPPSTFAGWPGKNFQKYEGVLGDLTSVWEDEGFMDSHIQEAVDACQTDDGNFAAVPIGSHRLNCLFYSTDVVEAAGVDPNSMSSLSDLISAMDQVAANTEAVPMAQAMTAPWTTLQLFGVVLLGQEGYDSYMTFVNGEGGGDAVRSALETTGTILSNYIPSDAASSNLTQSNELIMNDEAAFIHQGNWAAGAYRTNDLTYNEDWGFVPFPGTEGMYTLHIDSFLYPTNNSGENPSPEATKKWMSYAGSLEGQQLFDPLKGCIPTRTDANPEDFGPYLAETIEDFQNAEERPPTLAHGLAVSPTAMSQMKEVITNEFTGPYNVDAAATGLLEAAQQ
ncbi:carbohydrate ABC transporter substrate-binding protein, CUT1 family [Natronoarchaeum philippinense]|uniref:Carbohydrate ABC transporter substrate-binding protein, CUT1 family n=1 Tax=Natronoarchaeum philippinense TaxID=558529 RepID=A0A285N3P0_NATPI|nr:carbohydrate ABC transporter substrate-binding protein, CUT1 family [Natronoarchaeum philippinense]